MKSRSKNETFRPTSINNAAGIELHVFWAQFVTNKRTSKIHKNCSVPGYVTRQKKVDITFKINSFSEFWTLKIYLSFNFLFLSS
jgi:hypothetical protein